VPQTRAQKPLSNGEEGGMFALRWRSGHKSAQLQARVSVLPPKRVAAVIRIAVATENAILDLVFSATSWANYANNAAYGDHGRPAHC
jgi:hypothetical protein